MPTNSKEVSGSINKFKEVLAGMRNKKAGIEQKEREISETISTLKKSPVSIDDFAVFVRSAVDLNGRSWLRFIHANAIVGAFLGEETGFNKRSLEDLSGEMVFSSTLFKNMLHDNSATAAICALFPEQVTAAIIQRIRDESGDFWGGSNLVPVKDRQAMIVKLTEERDLLKDEAREAQEQIDEMIGEVL